MVKNNTPNQSLKIASLGTREKARPLIYGVISERPLSVLSGQSHQAVFNLGFYFLAFFILGSSLVGSLRSEDAFYF